MTSVWNNALMAYEIVFECKPDLNDFDERIKFQKTIYLLKLVGVDFGKLNFIWHKRGPYSFEIAGIFPNADIPSNALTNADKRRITDNKHFLRNLLSNHKNAELYSSVAFLLHEEKLSREEIIKKMASLKPWFVADEIKDAITKLKNVLPSIFA